MGDYICNKHGTLSPALFSTHCNTQETLPFMESEITKKKKKEKKLELF